MANINQRLRRKCRNANLSEHFVFLPNNLTDIKSTPSNETDPRVRDAIVAKNAGNECFKKDQYEQAILHYDSAIELLEGMDSKSCDVLLGICYQNRAATNAKKRNYVDAIADASKAVELNEHYAKAYYRRAMCYHAQNRNYRALQDIMQACILERFRKKQYIDVAIEIVAEIDKDPEIIQWKRAHEEMDAALLSCEVCSNQNMQLAINCGVFEAISVPVPDNPDNQPFTGYIRAMVGLKGSNIPEVMAGCDEEIELKGKYLSQSYIIQAYMSAAVIQLAATINDDMQKHIERMNDIISNVSVAKTVRHQAKLCRANLYNHSGRFVEADRDLKSLVYQYGNTGLFHVIKSGALLQVTFDDKSFLESLEECVNILPDVYDLQFQLVQAKTDLISDPRASLKFMMESLENLIERFPLELPPRVLLIGLYVIEEDERDISMLRQARKDFPNRMDEMIWLYGEMHPNHPSCVDFYKQAIRAHADDTNSLESLLDYFELTTYEYAKAIEVSTKALFNFLRDNDFKTMFERRQQLLKRIINNNFWNEL